MEGTVVLESHKVLQRDADSSTALTESAPRKGLSLWLAGAFIVGEMAGSGVLALPRAIADAGWSGVALLLMCATSALYAGICLGRCWLILEERWPEYREKMRYPYPAIAYRAVGVKTRYLLSACMNITLIGVSTVFLLLSSSLIGALASRFGISFCHWILILALVLLPLTWLGTPDDFWPAAVVALVTTMVACFLLLAGFIEDRAKAQWAEFESPTVESFFLAFGTILFSFGGAATFPTFQNDMKDKSQFPLAATVAFTVLLLLYLPVAVMGYAVYGSSLTSNAMDSLPESNTKIVIQIFLAIHLFFAFLLVSNPPAQLIEEFFNVPRRFGWKRCSIRTAMMLLVVFIAQTIPKFGKVLNLVGGSTVTLMTFVFPPLFYIKLCSQRQPDWPERDIPLHVRVYLIQIMVIGLVGGGISTYSAIREIAAPSAFNPPCYINATAAAM